MRPARLNGSVRLRRMFCIVFLIQLLGAVKLQADGPVCIQYEPHEVSFGGTVIYRTFVDAGGRPEHAALLLLDAPICVEQSQQWAENKPESEQIVIGLSFDPKRFGDEDALSGRRVIATGSLYHRHTAHHHAPLVLMVRELSDDDPNKPLQPTRAAQPNGQREPARSFPRG